MNNTLENKQLDPENDETSLIFFVSTSLFLGLYWIPGATWSIQGKDILLLMSDEAFKNKISGDGESPRFQGTDVYIHVYIYICIYTPPKANMCPGK